MDTQTRGSHSRRTSILPGSQGLRPGLLLIHGGAWTKGSKEAYQEWGPLLAQAGFAAIAVNYRRSSATNVGWPGALEDVRQAFHWMVAHARSFQINPQRIGVIGDSAGGQLAALLTLTYYIDPFPVTDACIRALVGAYGAYNLTPGQGKQENYLLERPDHALEHFMGETFQQAPEAYRSASPITYISQAKTNPQFNTRFLLTWGDADRVVAPYIEEDFARQLQQAEKQVRTVVIPGYDHFWFVPLPAGEGRTLQEYPNTIVAPQVVEFLRETLS